MESVRSDLHLRRLLPGELLSAGWTVMKRRASLFYLLVLVLVLPGALLTQLYPIAGVFFAEVDLSSALLSLFISMAGMIMFSVSASLLAADIVDGGHPGFAGLMVRAYRLLPGVITTGVLYALIFLAGLILLVIPGIYWNVLYSFAVLAAVLRGKSDMEALRYSRRLVRDQWWRIFGIYLLLFAVVAGVAIALGLTLGIAGSIIEMVTTVSAVKYLSSLVGPALYPFIWSVYVVLFLNEDAVLHGVDAGAVRPGETAVADVPAEAERDHAGS